MHGYRVQGRAETDNESTVLSAYPGANTSWTSYMQIVTDIIKLVLLASYTCILNLQPQA